MIAVVAQDCARLHVSDKRNECDALITASGLMHRMAVVTRNVAGSLGCGMALINPWEGSS